MYEQLKKQYEQGYIREDQLRRYLNLGMISEEEFDEIIHVKVR